MSFRPNPQQQSYDEFGSGVSADQAVLQRSQGVSISGSSQQQQQQQQQQSQGKSSTSPDFEEALAVHFQSTPTLSASTSTSNPPFGVAGSGSAAGRFVITDPSDLYHVNTGSSITLQSQLYRQQRGHSSLEFMHATDPTQRSNMSQDQNAHALLRGASASSSEGFTCPNCSKVFARDDLLRRHLAREARAQAQPSLDRQKSCYECARSKARCDLEVPSCGRCRARGKNCVYGARSGNPNVRRGFRETAEPDASLQWPGTPPMGESSQWSDSQGYVGGFPKVEGRSADEYESSDDNRNWSDSFHQYRGARAHSTSSTSTSGSFDLSQTQQHGYGQYSPSYPLGPQSDSNPDQFQNNVNPHLARGFARSGTKGSINTDVGGRAGIGHDNNEEGEVTPVNRANAEAMAGGGTMGPPQITPTRYHLYATPHLDAYPGAISPARYSNVIQKPQVPRLLTGAKMPRPQDGQGGGEFGSSRPIFSAQLDLSGWLEEPVIPSPLYRMGPSLSALGAGPGQVPLIPFTPTSGGNTAEVLRNALATNPPLPIASGSRNTTTTTTNNSSSSDTVMEHGNTMRGDVGTSSRKEGENGQDSRVAAHQWWANSSNKMQSDVEVQGVAQACAGHFTIYPALMVLPDPTSPVPPLFHRPWLAHTRLQTPASLARTRVLLAGYHVKLPSSEAMIWKLIAMEINELVYSFDQIQNSSDINVFSNTSSLWFLIILLLMSSGATSGAHIPEGLIDSSLIGLSHYTRLLSQRVKACEERRISSSASLSFIDWGFEETMKRTLFASYSLLVLQRFRETSTELQSQLAGIDLILDVPLPATAAEFEAGDELEWRASQHVQITEAPPKGLPKKITMRDLLNARKESSTEESRKNVTSYFDRHDDFTNVCLSVAFALDQGIC